MNRMIDSIRRPVRALAFLAISAMASATCSAQDVVIGEGLAAGWGQFFVADQQKLWQKEGLNPKSVTFASGRLVLDAVVGGSVLIGTAAETPVAFAALNGLPVRVIGTLNRHEPFDVVTRTDIKSLKDLKGKRIGYSQGTNAHYYLLKALGAADLKLTDVTAISLTPSDFVTSLVNGSLDAFIWTEPHISQAIKQGKGKIHAISTPGLYRSHSSIITLQSTIDKHPELLVKALRALLAADKSLKADPEGAIKIVADRIKLDPAVTRSFWPRLKFDVDLDKADLVKELESQAKWAIDNKLTRPDAKLPDFNAVVVTRFLDEARKK
ncbi:ABC transporter substrate-binding protein [Lacisediminimonas profundi]|uniref:ABC transporter substrate-binding protein n=1 Tax=Lacisediminimonas profundi TaxID=2603856 RepID=UPI00124BA1B8|nr:NrtA/SsuA/CpmA family ABC transporter substrate-binding protein [Lacisediminimonas profundi]